MVGQKITCGGCGKAIRVAAPRESAPETDADAAEPAPVVKFTCPLCGRKYATKPELAGKKIRCTGCGAGVRVPASSEDVSSTERSRSAVSATPAPSASLKAGATRGGAAMAPSDQGIKARAPQPPDADESDAYSLSPLEELASSDHVKPNTPVGAVLPSRAEAMQQVRQEVAKQEAETQQAAKTRKKKKRKKKKRAGEFDLKETLILVAGVGALVAVLAVVAWRLPDFRIILGGLLCVLGFIVYVMGLVSLRQLAAEEGAFKALLFRFFPPYQVWFVVSRWADTRDYVAFFIAGLLVLTIGGAVLKTAPMTKEEIASARAFERARGGRTAQIPTPPGLSDAIPALSDAVPAPSDSVPESDD
jgi:hypothetical protein